MCDFGCGVVGNGGVGVDASLVGFDVCLGGWVRATLGSGTGKI